MQSYNQADIKLLRITCNHTNQTTIRWSLGMEGPGTWWVDKEM
jgi:hypothetical protein